MFTYLQLPIGLIAVASQKQSKAISIVLWLRYASNPQTPLGEHTALPQPPSWFRGGAPGKRKEEGEWERRRGGEEGRGGEGKGG